MIFQFQKLKNVPIFLPVGVTVPVYSVMCAVMKSPILCTFLLSQPNTSARFESGLKNVSVSSNRSLDLAIKKKYNSTKQEKMFKCHFLEKHIPFFTK